MRVTVRRSTRAHLGLTCARATMLKYGWAAESLPRERPTCRSWERNREQQQCKNKIIIDFQGNDLFVSILKSILYYHLFGRDFVYSFFAAYSVVFQSFRSGSIQSLLSSSWKFSHMVIRAFRFGIVSLSHCLNRT